LVNLSGKTYTFEKGEKVAQLVILPIISAELVEVKELSETLRGQGSFGSTGKK
jgi:dUTP pyrophosphatase